MKKILAIPQDNYGCGQFRLIQPYRELKKEFMDKPDSKYSFDVIYPEAQKAIPLEYLKQFDGFILQRVCTVEQMNLFMELKKLGKKVIMDVDDDLNEVPEHNDFYKLMNHIKRTTGNDYLKIFESALKMSDYIMVTTPEIRQNFRKLYKTSLPIEIVPNAIDLKHPLIKLENSRRNQLPQDRVIVGWQGGSSHSDDLEIIKNMTIVLEKNPNVIFAFCSNNILYQKVFGNLPRHIKKQIVFIPPETIFDRYVSIPSMMDIGLAPLTMDKFNNGKSWLKCLEYGIFKVPTIASPSPDYERFNKVSQNGNVIVKSNKSIDFFNEIQKLIDNPNKRKQIGEKAYKAIVEKVNLTEMNKIRLNVLDRVFKDA